MTEDFRKEWVYCDLGIRRAIDNLGLTSKCSITSKVDFSTGSVEYLLRNDCEKETFYINNEEKTVFNDALYDHLHNILDSLSIFGEKALERYSIEYEYRPHTEEFLIELHKIS